MAWYSYWNRSHVTTTPGTLTVDENSPATSIEIAAPVDTRYSADRLVITVTGLPTDGTVLLSDGMTPIAIGQTLSVAELTSLKFLATPDMFGQTSTFTYRVTDPRGVSANGVETLTIAAHAGPQTIAASLTVNADSGLTPIGIAAPTDGSYAASDWQSW